MNRNQRNILAENLRHYLSGTITNFEFMNRIEPIYPTDDKGIRAIESEFWFYYDDLREHRNLGKHKLTDETEKYIKRFILFLKSDNEYEWKDQKFPNPIKWFLNLITFGIYSKYSDEKELENIEDGDERVWPFFRQSEFEKEINEPKYLNKKTT
ncbi:hypothetical protein [Gaetbulibacter jejuensis]|uniref:Uncharacterized protein n=1 Tax=Gaetbulibacter jejuensis TaxID=584607 RepID=A0ABN1JUJ3_9FLAO